MSEEISDEAKMEALRQGEAGRRGEAEMEALRRGKQVPPNKLRTARGMLLAGIQDAGKEREQMLLRSTAATILSGMFAGGYVDRANGAYIQGVGADAVEAAVRLAKHVADEAEAAVESVRSGGGEQ